MRCICSRGYRVGMGLALGTRNGIPARSAATIRAMLDRRHFVGVVGGLLGGLILPRRSAAQDAGIIPLGDRLSLLTSGGTNVLALSTPDGLVVVDSGAPELGDRVMG